MEFTYLRVYLAEDLGLRALGPGLQLSRLGGFESFGCKS